MLVAQKVPFKNFARRSGRDETIIEIVVKHNAI